jgi:DHA2 family multidrug resistance protein
MALFGVSVMVGPVLGPVIGGWLTDHYSWRWVFYINVPIGALALAGISIFMKETKISSAARMDWLGFGSLSIAIAAMQVFLDRGAQLDWFSSFEILIEAVVCASALYIFLVHTFTAKNSFVNPRLFLDRNFSVGVLFIFIVGITYLASLALLTPYLQTLMGYPVVTAGIVMGPRGLGTMACMFLVGRLVGRIDTRLLILIGQEDVWTPAAPCQALAQSAASRASHAASPVIASR